jgi:ribosomal protein S18 acetylase RimI-like enzyme
MTAPAAISIREMTKEDFPKIVGIFKDAFNALGEEWTDETATGHVTENFFEEAAWIAESEGEIVGFLMAALAVREKGTELFIDNVVVSPKWQGQGIGKLLWQQAEAYVSKTGLVGIRLLANRSFASYGWYEEMGFEKSGWIEMFKPA